MKKEISFSLINFICCIEKRIVLLLFTKLSLISVLVLHLKQENVLDQPGLEFKYPKPKRKWVVLYNFMYFLQ